MPVYYLFDDLRIPTKCICGLCNTDQTAIILARNAFRDKQVNLAAAANADSNDATPKVPSKLSGQDGAATTEHVQDA